MVVVAFDTRFCRLGEAFFEIPDSRPNVDMMLYRQIPMLVPHARCQSFSTQLINLSSNTGLLFNSISKGTRYEIRRAETRDRLNYVWADAATPENIDDFAAFYTRFAHCKALAPVSVRVLRRYAAAGVLDLSRISSESDTTLVWHAYYRTDRRVRLLYSASDLHIRASDGQLLGRANRYHHWRDMLRFKAAGIALFDLGGWAVDSRNPAYRNVSAFKAEFGGHPVLEYNCWQPITARGLAYLTLEALVGYARRAIARR